MKENEAAANSDATNFCGALRSEPKEAALKSQNEV
jgi:hypothetical protein